MRVYLQLKNVLAFSRGDSVNINHSPHDGLVIINKGNEEVEGTWPNKLQPGIYKNMGSNSVNIIINNTRKIIPPLVKYLRLEAEL